MNSLLGKKIQVTESPLIDVESGKICGYHTIISELKSGLSIGGGVSPLKETSFRIALSESYERLMVTHFFQDDEKRKKFYLDLFPSTCGFAAGFNFEKTFYRSFFEAVERYIWGKWIDEQIPISQIKSPFIQTPLFNYFSHFFNELLFFSQIIRVNHPLKGVIDVKVAIILALTDEGVFPGSRANFQEGPVWDHAIVECWRHLKIYQMSKSNCSNNDLIEKRISFFATHKKKALELIPNYRFKQEYKEIPKPKFYIPVYYEDKKSSIVIWRNLCYNYQGWEQGTNQRFVY